VHSRKLRERPRRNGQLLRKPSQMPRRPSKISLIKQHQPTPSPSSERRSSTRPKHGITNKDSSTLPSSTSPMLRLSSSRRRRLSLLLPSSAKLPNSTHTRRLSIPPSKPEPPHSLPLRNSSRHRPLHHQVPLVPDVRRLSPTVPSEKPEVTTVDVAMATAVVLLESGWSPESLLMPPGVPSRPAKRPTPRHTTINHQEQQWPPPCPLSRV